MPLWSRLTFMLAGTRSWPHFSTRCPGHGGFFLCLVAASPTPAKDPHAVAIGKTSDVIRVMRSLDVDTVLPSRVSPKSVAYEELERGYEASNPAMRLISP